MAVGSLRVDGIPDGFRLFAYGSGRHLAFWKYRLGDVADWAATADIVIYARTGSFALDEVDNDVYLLGDEPFDGAAAMAAAEESYAMLRGRARLLSGEEEFSITPLERDDGLLRFDARFDGHFIFGTAEIRHVFRFDDDEPVFVHVQIRAREGSGISARDTRFEGIRVAAAPGGTAPDRGARREPSPLMVRMHEEGIPPAELDRAAMETLEHDLEATLPELHIIGHLVARLNIVGRCLAEPDRPMGPAKALSWCREAARMALDLPDRDFRHFLAAAVQTEVSVLLDADMSLLTPDSVGALHRYVRLLLRLPDRTRGEVSLACCWFLAAFQDCADQAAIAAISALVVALPADDGSIAEHAVEAVRSTHSAVTGRHRGDPVRRMTSALQGIRRCELAVNLMHVAAERLPGSAGLAMHQALFSDIGMYNYACQAALYDLSADEVNLCLEGTMSGMPPCVLLLRPLSAVRTIYLPNGFEGARLTGPFAPDKPLPLISLEAALAAAVRPLHMATNAVGGLVDILGMGRSGTAENLRDSDAGWKTIVKTLLGMSDIVLVLPDVSSGLAWELQQLKHDMRMSNCIFVLLPEEYEWSDGGNRKAFSQLLGMAAGHLRAEGGFVLGDPADPDTPVLPWSSLWDGSLTATLARRAARPAAS